MSAMRSVSRLLLVLAAASAGACAAGAQEDPAGSAATTAAPSAQAADPGGEDKSEMSPLPADVVSALSTDGPIGDSALDTVYRLEHRINVGGNRRIAVTESFTLRSWLRWPHRAMMMIPAQGSNRSVYNIPFDGYDGGAIMARAGFFAFTVDPPGTGDSYQPADGLTVTYDSEAVALNTAADRLRAIRLVPRMDLWGEEIGGGVAMQMCADARRYRSCTAASMLYKTGSDFFLAVAPFFESFLLSSPDGYFNTFPEAYFNVLAGANDDVRNWYIGSQIGRYAAGTYKQDFDRVLAGGPKYDPREAAVPGLLIRGENETNNPLSDSQQLQTDYGSLGGGHAELVVVPNGSHILRLDAAPVGPSVWDITKAFVDPAPSHEHDGSGHH